MPKPRRPRVNPQSFFADKSRSPLPREKIEDMPFVFYEGRLIAPWPRGPMHFLDEPRLLAVLTRVDALATAGPVWIWSDPTRPVVPVQADDPRSWVQRWGADRASYQTRQRAA